MRWRMCAGIPVTDDMGIPCPGSLGTFAGAERQFRRLRWKWGQRARMPTIPGSASAGGARGGALVGGGDV